MEKRILSILEGARVTVEVAAYGFSNLNIANALVSAVQRGVKVTIVLDKSQTHGPQAKIHDQLEKAGADIRLVSPPRGIMHDKFMIVDEVELERGSYNYTDRAELANFENATFTTDATLAGKYHSDFQQIYSQGSPETGGAVRPIQRALRRLAARFRPER